MPEERALGQPGAVRDLGHGRGVVSVLDEQGKRGSGPPRWHAVGDEGIPLREIAQSIGDHLGVPTASIPADRLEAHFGFLAMVIVLDNPTSNLATRRILRSCRF